MEGTDNLYVIDSNAEQALMETLSGGNYTQSTIVTGLDFPQGIAVDGTQRFIWLPRMLERL